MDGPRFATMVGIDKAVEIVVSILSGSVSRNEAAQRNGVDANTIDTVVRDFLNGGRSFLDENWLQQDQEKELRIKALEKELEREREYWQRQMETGRKQTDDMRDRYIDSKVERGDV